MPLERDPHHVEGLTLEPVGGRPDGNDACDRLPVVEPHLDPYPRGFVGDPEQVVRDGEARRLVIRNPREALCAWLVQVSPGCSSDVACDLLLSPAEVVGRRDVAQEVEALLVAEVAAGLDEARGIDDERRLSERFLRLNQSGDPGVRGHCATPRIS